MLWYYRTTASASVVPARTSISRLVSSHLTGPSSSSRSPEPSCQAGFMLEIPSASPGASEKKGWGGVGCVIGVLVTVSSWFLLTFVFHAFWRSRENARAYGGESLVLGVCSPTPLLCANLLRCQDTSTATSSPLVHAQ